MNRRKPVDIKKLNLKRGALMLVISTFCIAMSSALIHMAGDLPALEKQFVRSVVMLAFSSITVMRNKSELKVRKEYALPLFLRGLCGAISCSFNFYAIDHLPLATANMLAKLAPFFTVIFAWLFLKEKIRKINIAALIVAFIGVAFAVGISDGTVQPFPAFTGIMSGVMGGAAFTALRACDKKGAPNAVTVISFSLGTLIFSIPTMLFGYVPMSLSQLLWLIGSGVIATVGHFCIAMAYRYAAPAKVSVFDYCQIVWSALLGIVFFWQIPSLHSIVGYCIIIATGVAVFMDNQGKLFRKK